MPKVTIIGEGCSAIRVFWNTEGCEIRFGERIIHCNNDLAGILRIITSYDCDGGIDKLLELTGESEHKSISILQFALYDLELAGIPRVTWKTWGMLSHKTNN